MNVVVILKYASIHSMRILFLNVLNEPLEAVVYNFSGLKFLWSLQKN